VTRVALLVVAMAACSPPDRGPRWRPAGATTPRDGGTLRFAAKDGLSTLDPAIAYDEASIYALQLVLDRLVDYAPGSTRLVPRLAERWEVAPDGKTYQFWLRPGVAYADGRPIVAADVAFSLERVLTTADSPFGSMLLDLDGAQDVLDHKAAHCRGIEVRGDRELVLHLARPNAALIYVFAMPFSAPLTAAHVAATGDQLRSRPLASGPYRLVEWDEGRHLVFERNPHYFDRNRQHLERIVLLENIPRDTQFLMFERGELDTAERLSAPDYLWITAQQAWQPYVHTQALMNIYGSRMNVRKKPFDDVRVRRALNYALDKQHIVKLLHGSAVAAHGMLAPGAFGRDDTLAPYPHDPAKARALLAEAGYADGLALDYVTIDDDEARTLAQSMKHDFEQVGVTLRISVISFSAYVTAIGNPDGPPFTLGTWLGDFPDPTSFFDVKLHSRSIADDSSLNDCFYANPELDALLDTARAEPDVAKRAAMYQRADRIVHDDAPWLWGYHQLMLEVTQPYVRDYAPHPVWIRDYTGVWLDVGADGDPVPR
jgi:ABC-type transport system substrate-binding protein